MKLLVMEGTHLTEYEVNYDTKAMDEFLNTIVKDYGKCQHLQVKAKNEDEILTQYNDCKNLEIINKIEDNSKIHIGKRRVQRPVQPKKYLYSFTVVDYPEIYYTITDFLKSEIADLGAFDKFLNPEYYVGSIYPASTLYDPLDPIGDLGLLIYNGEQAKLRYSLIIEKWKNQGNCIKDFYKILNFTIIREREIKDYESLNILKRIRSNIPLVFSTYDVNSCLNSEVFDVLANTLTHKEIKTANENYKILEQMKRLSKDEVKSMTPLHM